MKAVALAALLLVQTAPSEIIVEGSPAQGGLARGIVPPGTRTLTLDGRDVPLAPDGRFVIGFGRDAAAQVTLLALSATGQRTLRRLSVTHVTRQLRNLPTLPKATPRTPRAIAARAAEIARVEAARASLQPVEGWRQRFRWPVTGRVSGVFGSQTIYAGEPGSWHTGVDIARPTGTPIVAPANGIVVLASPPQFSVEGNLLILDHGMGLSSAFLHLAQIDVTAGDRVRQGQRLGAIGTTGRSTGPHLHWGLVWRGVRVDPQPLAGPMPGSTGRAEGGA